MPETYKHIIWDEENSVARITLNRPDVLNSFTLEMSAEVQDALKVYARRSELRCLVLTGAGKGFCAGQDLKEALTPGLRIDQIVERTYNPMILGITGVEKPVIAAVNGVAAGAGANLAFACDMVLAAESVHFIQSFIHIGLIPDSGGTFVLPRMLGHQRAMEAAILGQKMPAQKALDWGLVNSVVPDAELEKEAMELAQKLAALPTLAIGLTKKAFHASRSNNLEHQLSIEMKLQAQAGASQDFKEGVNAFLEKRRPEFKGH